MFEFQFRIAVEGSFIFILKLVAIEKIDPRNE